MVIWRRERQMVIVQWRVRSKGEKRRFAKWRSPIFEFTIHEAALLSSMPLRLQFGRRRRLSWRFVF